MFSEAVSLSRLRLYEQECRKSLQTTQNPDTDSELAKFTLTLQRATRELEALLYSPEAGDGPRVSG
jgi:hypothetical protein